MDTHTTERTIEYIRKCIKDASNIVAVVGLEMLVEGGGKNFDSNDETYRIEQEYGYSHEELLTGSFYCAKKERFYQFYKKEILGMTVESTPAYDALYKLQEQGKLKVIINQNYHPVPSQFHFNRVINLNGDKNSYHCPKCHRQYDDSYVLRSEGIPNCEKCKVAIRPNIRLIGERINNNLMTEALDACDKADLVLVLGRNMFGDYLQSNAPETLRHRQKRIIFTSEKFVQYENADFIIYDEIQKILPQLVN